MIVIGLKELQCLARCAVARLDVFDAPFYLLEAINCRKILGSTLRNAEMRSITTFRVPVRFLLIQLDDALKLLEVQEQVVGVQLVVHRVVFPVL